MTNLELYNIIEDIVNTIRPAVNILSITKKNATHYTIEVDSTEFMSNYDVIEVVGTANFNGQYKIVNLASTIFDISKTGTFATEIGVLYHLKPYFRFGNWVEIANELSISGKSNMLQDQKYPFIFLHSDIDISNSKDVRYKGEASFTLYIIDHTEANDSTKERIDHVYSPTLYILESLLFKAITDSRKFDFSQTRPFGNIPHDRKEFYYYGSPKENKLNDTVDAIEIKFKDFKVFKNTCPDAGNDVLIESFDGYIMQDINGKFLAVTYN